MKKFIFAMMGMLLFAPSAFAAGYGDAGCGLGSLLFQDQPGFVQIFAATSNGTSYNQAFAISSGTSNCDAKPIVLAQEQQERFVENNFSGLAKEMAAGNGEQLSTLAGLLGCPAATQARFSTVAQHHYAAIFASDGTTPAEMLAATKAVMSRDAELSTACSR